MVSETSSSKMNSTEVQNHRHKLDDKCLCRCLVPFLPACAKAAVFQKLSYSLCGLCLTLPQTVRLFYVSLRSQAPQQQYTIQCMHYSIYTLWAYLSEQLVKDSHKCLSLIVRVTEKYTETLHVKKMAAVSS